MLTIRKAKRTIDTELWNALKEGLKRDLAYYKDAPYDPYDPEEVHMGDLAFMWYHEPDRKKAESAFLKELIIRYRRMGGRFVGEEDKPLPKPLKLIEYKYEGSAFTPSKEQVVQGVPNPPKQLDLFKNIGGKR